MKGISEMRSTGSIAKATSKEQTVSSTRRSVLLPGLRQARQRSGRTQRELGELAGIGKTPSQSRRSGGEECSANSKEVGKRL